MGRLAPRPRRPRDHRHRHGHRDRPRDPRIPPLERRHPARIGPLLGNLARLGRDGAFLGYALSYAFTYGAFIIYIGSSSFIVQSAFGHSALAYSAAFSAGSLCFVAGALGGALLARRVGPTATLRAAHLLALASAGALVVLAVSGTLTFAAWIPLTCLFSAGIAGGMAGSTARALARAGFAAGAGSAALGLFQYIVGAIVTPIGGLWGDGTAIPTVVGMTVGIVVAAGAAAFGGSRTAR
nr:MFS transporter [Microbacterium karelineae]